MEERKKVFFDAAEIDRIQREIELSLYNSGPQAGPAQGGQPPTGFEPEAPAVSYEGLPVSEETAAGAQAALGEMFYRETVRNEAGRHKKGFKRKGALVVALCTFGTMLLGFALGVGIPLAKNYYFPSINVESSGNTVINVPEPADESKLLAQTAASETVVVRSMADVIKLTAPSVVSIKTMSGQPKDYFSWLDEGGSGSGVIFSQNADCVFISTNYHVITGASAVSINIGDSADISASFVGSDPDADLAVISVSKKAIRDAGISRVSIAVFGDSSLMQAGEPVLAIGNALGEGNIVTSGIVSAVNKEIDVDGYKLLVIQTDAAINPGNSGGPLINASGEVIGVNTASLSRSNAEGMGFSVASNVAKPILDGIIQNPKPFLGIQGMDLTKELTEYYALPDLGLGVLVQEVVPGSSAQKAGIQRTDVITGFNGTAVFSMKQLSAEVQKCKVGDEVIVKVYRDGSSLLEFVVKLAEYKTDNF